MPNEDKTTNSARFGERPLSQSAACGSSSAGSGKWAAWIRLSLKILSKLRYVLQKSVKEWKCYGPMDPLVHFFDKVY